MTIKNSTPLTPTKYLRKIRLIQNQAAKADQVFTARIQALNDEYVRLYSTHQPGDIVPAESISSEAVAEGYTHCKILGIAPDIQAIPDTVKPNGRGQQYDIGFNMLGEFTGDGLEPKTVRLIRDDLSKVVEPEGEAPVESESSI